MAIVLVAEESAGIHVLRMVAQSEHRLVAVLTESVADGSSRGATVAAVAQALGVPVRPARLVKDPGLAQELRSEQVDVLLNIHSLYRVASEVVAAPRIGSFNLHPGPLPEYAGLDVPSWAIYHGRTRHGVTLHWMAPGIDTGPVAFAAEFALTSADTGLSASAKCVKEGLPLLAELLRHLAERAPVPAIEQDLSHRCYYSRRVPHDGWVPWSASARQVVDFIRACDYAPWPSPWGPPRTAACSDGESEIEIVRAMRTGQPTTAHPGTVGRAEDGSVLVAASDEWVLVRRVRVGGRSTPPAEALRSGDRLALPPSDRSVRVTAAPPIATTHMVAIPVAPLLNRTNTAPEGGPP